MPYFDDPVRDDKGAAFETCRQALADLPEVSQQMGGLIGARPLGGLTNRVFWLEAARGDFVLRLPRAASASLIDRRAERQALEVAARLGVGVPPIVCDAERGVLLLPGLKDEGPATPAQVGAVLARLHGSPEPFEAVRALPPYLDLCRDRLRGSEEALALSEPASEAASALMGLLAAEPLVPCHFDPAPGNILLVEGRALLVDFEYAAMAPAAWDLAYACLEHDYDTDAEAAFLDAYGAGSRRPPQRVVEACKVICDVISMLWALDQQARGNDADDFTGFALQRRDRALARLAAMG
ncbi:choline kinase family protein [Roseibium aestuarii]|uniref:Phosphotransferase n=1 Tax=Roseibium aestuarii TaxID=2600299 RepID=A0ABW4K074_9HYPH|nr:choline kinase family protein [Roseibium aestuarii]